MIYAPSKPCPFAQTENDAHVHAQIFSVTEVLNCLWLWAGRPILFCGPHGKLWAKTSYKVGRRFGKNEGEWIGKVEIRTRKKFLAVGKACTAIFWPTPGFKIKPQKENSCHCVSSGFSTEGTLIYASVVPVVVPHIWKVWENVYFSRSESV